MRRYLTYDENRQSDFILGTMVIFAFLLIAFGFLCDTPRGILEGVLLIVQAQAGLITDSIVIGGMGGAFVNAGLVTLISIALIKLNKLNFTGISIACIFLMAGFSLFGKDICNIFPIILGGYLYSMYRKEHFGRYLYISLFGTALAPVVTEVVNVVGYTPFVRFLMGSAIGMLIGFILPPIAAFSLRVHQGYNLYNVGFSAGLIGMVIASFFKSFGHTIEQRFQWSTGNNLLLGVSLCILFGGMIFTGYWFNDRSFHNFARITRHTGRMVADFVQLDGYPVTLINMGVIGAAATFYVLLVGGELNGPTIGGVMTIAGFGAFGKHIKNITPVVLGVAISSFFMVWSLDDPNTLLSALFATGLAPIAGQYGWKWGMVAGAVHASVVLNIGILHGGLNLYNNGFSAGLVCIVMVPLIETMRKQEGV